MGPDRIRASCFHVALFMLHMRYVALVWIHLVSYELSDKNSPAVSCYKLCHLSTIQIVRCHGNTDPSVVFTKTEHAFVHREAWEIAASVSVTPSPLSCHRRSDHLERPLVLETCPHTMVRPTLVWPFDLRLRCSDWFRSVGSATSGHAFFNSRLHFKTDLHNFPCRLCSPLHSSGK
jgi:hypothetical protein